jgi:hypothetical protein
MATFTWYLQGTSPTTIEATDVLKFAGGAFATPITVGAYNDSTHVASSVDADDSSANTPHNTKYVAAGTLSLDGGATSNCADLASGNCPLKINFSDASSVTTTAAIFYAYDGNTTTEVPTGVTFQAFELGDAAWTNAEGSAAAVTINDDTASTSHDYFFGVSASPESVGAKTAFKLRIELTYS